MNAQKHIKRTVLLYPREDGYWVAEVPSLPGCISQGESRDKADSFTLNIS